MSKKNILIVLILLAVGALVYIGNRPVVSPKVNEPIKIGYFGPFTGPAAGTSGEVVANGWKLAVSERGKIAGRDVEIIYEDEACDPKKAVSAVNKLLTVDKVTILVNGVCSGSMVATMPIAEENKVILFTPTSTSPKITDGGNYVFRTSASSVHTAKAMREAIKKLGYAKVGVLFENAEYSAALKDALVAGLKEDGVIVLLEEGVNSNTPDISSQILKIAESKPEIIVASLNSTVTVSAFIKQVGELNVQLPIMGNEYFAFNNVVANPEAEGVMAAQYLYDAQGQKVDDFLALYEVKYHKKPSQDIYAMLAYDGYNVLADAIEKCGDALPDCVRDELYKVSSYEGLSGTITIDANGDTDRQFTVKKIVGGKLIDIQ